MATGPRKPPTRRNTLAGRGSGVPKQRGRPPGKAAAARQAAASSSKPAVRKKAATKQAPARKTARIPAPPQARVPRKAATGRAAGKTAALAVQIERINDGLGAIADLLGEVQGLRARFDAFAQRVETLLTARTAKPVKRVDPPQTEESHPAPAEEPHRTPSTAGEDEEPAETDDAPPEAST